MYTFINKKEHLIFDSINHEWFPDSSDHAMVEQLDARGGWQWCDNKGYLPILFDRVGDLSRVSPGVSIQCFLTKPKKTENEKSKKKRVITKQATRNKSERKKEKKEEEKASPAQAAAAASSKRSKAEPGPEGFAEAQESIHGGRGGRKRGNGGGSRPKSRRGSEGGKKTEVRRWCDARARLRNRSAKGRKSQAKLARTRTRVLCQSEGERGCDWGRETPKRTL